MKKFEISAYGVEEMKSQEMKSVDGGILGFVIKSIVGGLIFEGWCALGRGFANGSFAGVRRMK